MQPQPSVQPTLSGERLDLRPFTLADAPSVQALAGAREVASTTLTIPHPYPDGAAEAWIATHADAFAAGKHVSFAVVERASGELAGATGLALKPEHGRAELGYWIGVPFWNRGYATEAAALVTRFAFEALGLNRVHAQHFTRNPASGRVLQKIGMRHEGRLRQQFRRWDAYEDVEQYGLLRDEWAAARAKPHPIWQLWRQDDNGVRVLIATFGSEAAASERLARFEALQHKQIYWIEPAAG